MIIKSLELADFRNYDSLHIDFSSGTNILYGDNAQGKTNILESIYMYINLFIVKIKLKLNIVH